MNTPFTTKLSAEQLAEARQAVVVATRPRLYPTLTLNGVEHENPVGAPLNGDDAYMEIATAIAFLRLCTPMKRGTLNSYWLKHRAEAWGREQGLSSYVANGALIAAAVYLGFPTNAIRCDGRVITSLNVLVGVRKSSLPEGA